MHRPPRYEKQYGNSLCISLITIPAAYQGTIHAKRVTIQQKDIKLAFRIGRMLAPWSQAVLDYAKKHNP